MEDLVLRLYAAIPREARIDAQGICSTKIGQTLKKIFSILSVPKYRYSINATVGAQPFSIEVAVSLLGVPTAKVSMIMSSEMEGDAKFASTAATLSTLVSLFSLCLWSYLIGFLGP